MIATVSNSGKHSDKCFQNGSNLNILKLFMRSAGFFGIYPFEIESLSERVNISLIYIVLIMSLWIICLIYAGFNRLLFKVTTFEFVLNGLEIFVSVLLFLTILIINIRHPLFKKKFFNKLRIFDNKCVFSKICERNNIFGWFTYICVHIIFPCFLVVYFILLAHLFGFEFMLNFVPQQIGIFYEVFIVTLLWEISSVLQVRYNFINLKLNNFLQSEMICHTVLRLQLQEIKMLYRLLYCAVKQINMHFGFLLLLISCHLIVIFTANFNSILYLTWHVRTDVVILNCVLGPIGISVSLKIVY